MTKDLKHFGIPGMRWGIRRGPSRLAQRLSGKITTVASRIKAKSKVDTSSEDSKIAKTLKKKKLSEMSNDELKKLTTRMQLERQYKDLSSKEISIGKKIAIDIGTTMLKDTMTVAVNKIGAVAMTYLSAHMPKPKG